MSLQRETNDPAHSSCSLPLGCPKNDRSATTRKHNVGGKNWKGFCTAERRTVAGILPIVQKVPAPFRSETARSYRQDHSFSSAASPSAAGKATADPLLPNAGLVVAPISSDGTASLPTPAVPPSVLRICSHASTFAAAAESLTQSSLTSITAFIEGFVMRSVYEEKVAVASKNARTIVQGTARLCSPVFGNVCKAIWPFKTAEQLAALVGCSVRAAAYEISGEREPSAQSILAVMNAIIPRRERT